MKFSQILQTFSGACLALSLFASVTVAVPINTTQILEIRADPVHPEAQKFIKALGNAGQILQLTGGKKFLCFYTGSTKEEDVVYPVYQHLEEVKRQLTVLENGDQFITIDDLMTLLKIDTSNFQFNDWLQCSIPYAAFAEGKAVVVIGEQYKETSVYFSAEKPTMEAEGKVNHINAYSLEIQQRKPQITFAGTFNLAKDLKADQATCRVSSGLRTPRNLTPQGSPSSSKPGSPGPDS